MQLKVDERNLVAQKEELNSVIESLSKHKKLESTSQKLFKDLTAEIERLNDKLESNKLQENQILAKVKSVLEEA